MSFLEVTLSRAAIVISCDPGPVELIGVLVPGRVFCGGGSGAGNRLGSGYSGYRFPTEIVSYVGWMSGVVIARDPDNGGDPRHEAGSLGMEKLIGNQIEHKLFGFLTN